MRDSETCRILSTNIGNETVIPVTKYCNLLNEFFFFFRPFGSCAEVLTTGTVENYFLPVIVSCTCILSVDYWVLYKSVRARL